MRGDIFTRYRLIQAPPQYKRPFDLKRIFGVLIEGTPKHPIYGAKFFELTRFFDSKCSFSFSVDGMATNRNAI